MKSQTIGILFIAAGLLGMFWVVKEQVDAQRAQLEAQQAAQAEAALTQDSDTQAPETSITAGGTSNTPAPSPLIAQSSPAAEAPESESAFTTLPATPDALEQTFTIENKFLRVTFTNKGGAIKHIEFIGRDQNDLLLYSQTIEGKEPYAFNKISELPALALSSDNGSDGPLSEFAPTYELIAQKDTLIQFRLSTPEGLQIIRGYQVLKNDAAGDPYIIKHETRVLNPTETALPLNTLYFNLGTLPPTEGDNLGQDLNFAWLQNGDVDMISASKFTNSDGFFGIGSRTAVPFIRQPSVQENEPVTAQWAAIKNQFFTGILMPSQAGNRFYITGYDLGQNEAGKPKVAINASLGFDLGVLDAGEDTLLGFNYYVGPKEVGRLEALGNAQDELMQFGWGPIGFLGEILLAALKAIHTAVSILADEWAWGISIIVLTCIVKGSLFPLTAVQIRSSKKMQLIAEPMKAMREKYQDNPQKLQAEMMKLFKENKVNPAAGCLPILIQFPIFIGLFYMLRTASELRFGSFLWVDDLSVPDSVEWLPIIPYEVPLVGGPIHILPILMCISMYYQMKMMPTPSVDNVQVKILKFMPFIFFPITYGFPSGITLYWTVSNLLTILQTYLTRDMRGEAVIPASAQPSKKKTKMQRKGKK